MKCWTICEGEVIRGISLVDGKIEVGDEGRGRRLVRVDPPPNAQIVQIEGVPTMLEVQGGSGACLLIKDHSGYRGTWELCQLSEPDEKPVRVAPDKVGLVLACGQRAQGAAGRMGGGPEYLMICQPGSWLIRREGRTYGRPKLVTVVVTNDNVTTVDTVASIMAAQAYSKWPQ